MEVASFHEKLNKIDGKIYVIEEEIVMPESGIYEAELQHDNINEATLTVYTGSKLTGDRIQTYSLSTQSLTPWKQMIRIQTTAPVVYICYETDGDTVEAEDVNRLQSEVVKTQQAINTEEERAAAVEKEILAKIASGSGDHPESGVEAGTYRSVTVDSQGHVTAGSNPITLDGYGITDALKKNAVTWADLGGA